MSALTDGGVRRKTKLRMANNSKGRAEMEGFKKLGFELMYAGKDIQEGIRLYESSDLGSKQLRQYGLEESDYPLWRMGKGSKAKN